jgi:hypothetical protein
MPTALRFTATIIEWRGPSPYFYAPIPLEHVDDIQQASRVVSYGWGVIPVEAVIGMVAFTTSLFPKSETYLLPLKADVRRRCAITVGDTIDIAMTLGR